MKILMVCLGNICRSPLAEGIMREKIARRGLDWEVDSAGTGGWHAGEGPDRRSVLTAKQRGIDISNQRARQFRVEDFERFDRIFAMDIDNLRHILAMAPTAHAAEKAGLILDATYPGQNREAPDPYYGGQDGFERVYDLLDQACEAAVRQLMEQV